MWGRKPQRSPLSVLLLLIYINHIPIAEDDILFMHDCAMFPEADTKKVFYEEVPERFDLLDVWLVEFSIFNLKKSEVLPHCSLGKARLLLI